MLLEDDGERGSRVDEEPEGSSREGEDEGSSVTNFCFFASSNCGSRGPSACLRFRGAEGPASAWTTTLLLAVLE
jgi:hypothetical protein